MNTVEEKLQQAARNHAKTEELNDFKSDVSGFIAGAKSPESLEYWKEKEKLYSEEEVYNILEQSMKDCYNNELDSHYSGDYKNLKKWFDFNKKYT